MATSFTAADLLELPPPSPSNWIVEGLIRTGRGRPSLLCGFPESGKSTLSNQLAVAVANGADFLGRQTKQGHVVLWKAEDALEDIADDLRKAGLTASSELSIVLPGPDESNIARVDEELKRFPNTRLVIIETLFDFFQNVKDITKNDECKEALQEFNQKLVTAYPDCAFLILHQFGKSNDDAKLSAKKVLGGTALVAGTDAKIFLEQVSDTDPRRVIYATVRKGRAIPPTYLKFNPDTLTASLNGTVEVEDREERKRKKSEKSLELESQIFKVISEHPGLSKWKVVEKVVEEVPARAATASKRIDDLIGNHFIEVKQGTGKGQAQLLFLPMSDAEYLAQKLRGGEHDSN
jgi:hypothetical protein